MSKDKGQNVVFDRENIHATFDTESGRLTITIDTKSEVGPSSSGKNMLVATTRGNKALPIGDGLTLAINAYRPMPVKAEA